MGIPIFSDPERKETWKLLSIFLAGALIATILTSVLQVPQKMSSTLFDEPVNTPSIIPSAYAAALTKVVAMPSNNIMGAKSYYVINLVTSTDGIIKSIDITFPTGYSLTGTARMIQSSGIGAGFFKVSGQTWTYKVISPVNVVAGTQIQIMMGEITNSNKASNQIAVSTIDGSGTIIDGPTLSNVINLGTTVPDDSITTGKIKDGTITGADIAADPVLVGGLEWNNGKGSLTPDQGGSIELGDSLTNTAGPYIDFHFGTGTAEDANVRIQNNGDHRFSVYASKMTVEGAEVLGMTDTKVGIGTDNPLELLQLSDDWAFHSGANDAIFYNAYHDSSTGEDRYIRDGWAAAIRATPQDPNALFFQSATGGSANGPITWNNAIVIANDGTVFIDKLNFETTIRTTHFDVPGPGQDDDGSNPILTVGLAQCLPGEFAMGGGYNVPNIQAKYITDKFNAFKLVNTVSAMESAPATLQGDVQGWRTTLQNSGNSVFTASVYVVCGTFD